MKYWIYTNDKYFDILRKYNYKMRDYAIDEVEYDVDKKKFVENTICKITTPFDELNSPDNDVSNNNSNNDSNNDSNNSDDKSDSDSDNNEIINKFCQPWSLKCTK